MDRKHSPQSRLSYGAAFGLFPIGWIVLNAIFSYNLSVETGGFKVLQNRMSNLSSDRRIQALMIGFSFGAFIEGFAGFGAPVAIAGALMIGLGFRPLDAAKAAQKVTAQQLDLSPILTAASNSSGGVLGKIINAQSIVVASAASGGQKDSPDAGTILRAVFWHSIALGMLMGILVMLQAYVFPWMIVAPPSEAP